MVRALAGKTEKFKLMLWEAVVQSFGMPGQPLRGRGMAGGLCPVLVMLGIPYAIFSGTLFGFGWTRCHWTTELFQLGFLKFERSGVSPVPGLAHEPCQKETQAVANKGEDGPNDPEGGGDNPGGLVQDAPDHGDDDDQSKARDGADLQRDQGSGVSESQCKGLPATRRVVDRLLDLEDLLGGIGPSPFDKYPETNGDEKSH